MSPRTPQKLVSTSENDTPFHASLLRSFSSREPVSDSEEEVQNRVLGPRKVIELIEISSDESEEDSVGLSHNRQRLPKQATRKDLNYSRRRIVESSDEDSDAVEIIELSDSSVEVINPGSNPVAQHISKSPARLQVKSSFSSSEAEVDEAIIVFDEPKSARTPLRIGPSTKKDVSRAPRNPGARMPSTPKTNENLGMRVLTNINLDLPSDLSTSVSGLLPAKDTPGTSRSNGKKARQAADLQKRVEYAQKIFDVLNRSVFRQGLPESTKLVWNKRLLTTAGKAKFHRSREGVQTTSVELAEKILDSEERIRNTLSHEMCHLATWVIDNKIDEHHGKLFKSWASRVEKKHPHIEVSIKHNYEISYPFEWKCENCAKIYGRFSKSIKPAECLCGACKEGQLVPQFASGRKPHAPKLSRMAAAKPQDSPRALKVPSLLANVQERDSEEEEDVIKSLMQSLASTSIV